MNYLDRNTLPKFQERLDLAASELNDMEDVIVAAINELAGRLYVISAMIPEEDRSRYCEEVSFPILAKLSLIQTQVESLGQDIESIRNSYDTQIETINTNISDIEARLNALDDAAARKEDLNVLLWRSGQEE